jgi:hypothetical protein
VVVFGVVLAAVAVEEAVAHPHQALPAAGSLAVAAGVWLTHGAPVTWSLLVVALGLLLLGAAEPATANASRRA